MFGSNLANSPERKSRPEINFSTPPTTPLKGILRAPPDPAFSTPQKENKTSARRPPGSCVREYKSPTTPRKVVTWSPAFDVHFVTVEHPSRRKPMPKKKPNEEVSLKIQPKAASDIFFPKAMPVKRAVDGSQPRCSSATAWKASSRLSSTVANSNEEISSKLSKNPSLDLSPGKKWPRPPTGFGSRKVTPVKTSEVAPKDAILVQSEAEKRSTAEPAHQTAAVVGTNTSKLNVERSETSSTSQKAAESNVSSHEPPAKILKSASRAAVRPVNVATVAPNTSSTSLPSCLPAKEPVKEDVPVSTSRTSVPTPVNAPKVQTKPKWTSDLQIVGTFETVRDGKFYVVMEDGGNMSGMSLVPFKKAY